MRESTTDLKVQCAFALTLLAAIPLLGTTPIFAAVIFESSTMGPPGQTSGTIVASNQFLGSRFHLDDPVNVTSIGGHLRGSTGTMFGVIVPLATASALPTGSPFDGSELVSTTFAAGSPSSHFLTPVSVTLPAGDYALIFGSGLFGATGSGVMPNVDTDLPGASYFFWDAVNWRNGGFSSNRFVIEGDLVPATPSASTWSLAVLVGLLSLGLLVMLAFRRPPVGSA